jgi:hypothetical protein
MKGSKSVNKVRLVLLMSLLAACFGSLSAADKFMAGDQSLLLMPTAYTMPKGKISLTDIDIFIGSCSYAITGSTHISGAMIVPLNTELFQSFTVSIKQNYLKTGMLQSAAWANYNPALGGAVIGNVVSLGDYNGSVHIAAAWSTDLNKIYKDYAIMGGGMFNLSKSIAVIAEVLSTSQIYEDYEEGLVSAGFRFKSPRITLDIGGCRLLKDNPDDLGFFPLAKLTMLF